VTVVGTAIATLPALRCPDSALAGSLFRLKSVMRSLLIELALKAALVLSKKRSLPPLHCLTVKLRKTRN
jgi:hypothetical protein